MAKRLHPRNVRRHPESQLRARAPGRSWSVRRSGPETGRRPVLERSRRRCSRAGTRPAIKPTEPRQFAVADAIEMRCVAFSVERPGGGQDFAAEPYRAAAVAPPESLGHALRGGIRSNLDASLRTLQSELLDGEGRRAARRHDGLWQRALPPPASILEELQQLEPLFSDALETEDFERTCDRRPDHHRDPRHAASTHG